MIELDPGESFSVHAWIQFDAATAHPADALEPIDRAELLRDFTCPGGPVAPNRETATAELRSIVHDRDSHDPPDVPRCRYHLNRLAVLGTTDEATPFTFRLSVVRETATQTLDLLSDEGSIEPPGGARAAPPMIVNLWEGDRLSVLAEISRGPTNLDSVEHVFECGLAS